MANATPLGKRYEELDFYQQKIIDAYGVDDVASGFTRQVENYKTDPTYDKDDPYRRQQIRDRDTGVVRYRDTGELVPAKNYTVKTTNLQGAMDAYWASINQATRHDFKDQAVSPRLFDQKPPNAPDTYPFLVKKASYSPTDQQEINYMHNLIKMLHRKDPSIGASLMSEIANNEMIRKEDPNSMINRKKRIAMVTSDLQRLLSRVKRKIVFAVPVEQPSIYIDTRKSTFETAFYNVSKFVIPTASFSIDKANDYHPGTRLQQYHDSLYSNADRMLRSIGNKQEAINQYRMRHMKREWDHYSAMFSMDFTRLPPAYDPLPHTNSWISKNNLKFLKLDRCYHQDLLSRPWTITDYVYFDPTLVDDEAGYEAWKVWAEKEKRRYAKLCMEEFERPSDWKVQETGDKNATDANGKELKIWRTLQAPSKPYQLKELRKFKKVIKKRKAWVLPNAPCLTEAEQAAEETRKAIELAKKAEEAAAAISLELELAQRAKEEAKARAQAEEDLVKKRRLEAEAKQLQDAINAKEEEVRRATEAAEKAKREAAEKLEQEREIQRDEVAKFINDVASAEREFFDSFRGAFPKTNKLKKEESEKLVMNMSRAATERENKVREEEEEAAAKAKKEEIAKQQKQLEATPFAFAKITLLDLTDLTYREDLESQEVLEINNIYATRGNKLAGSLVKSIVNSNSNVKFIVLSPNPDAEGGGDKLIQYYKNNWGMHEVDSGNYKLDSEVFPSGFRYLIVSVDELIKTPYFKGVCGIGGKDGELTYIENIDNINLTPKEYQTIVKTTKLKKNDGTKLYASTFKDQDSVNKDLEEQISGINNGHYIYYHRGKPGDDCQTVTKCESNFDRRLTLAKRHLQGKIEPRWIIASNKIIADRKEYSIDSDGMKEALIGEGSTEKIVCNAEHPEVINNKSKQLLTWVKTNREAINKKWNKDRLDKRLKQIEDKLSDKEWEIIVTESNAGRTLTLVRDEQNRMPMIPPNEIILLTGEYAGYDLDKIVNYGNDKKWLQNALNKLRTLLERYVPKPKGPEVFNVERKNKNLYTFNRNGKRWFLRTLTPNVNDRSHENLLNAMNGQNYDYVANVEYFNEIFDSNGDAGVYEVKNKNKEVQYKFVFTIGQKPVGMTQLYIQPFVGDTLQDWVEKTYSYQFEDVEKRNKKVIKSMTRTRTDEQKEELKTIAFGVEKALDEFHKIDGGRFLHRDVKLENMAFDGTKVVLFDFDNVFDTESNPSPGSPTMPMKNGTKIMDRFLQKKEIQKWLFNEKGNNKQNRFLDKHQAGMMLLQLGGVFDWVAEYGYKDTSSNPNKDFGIKRHGEWLWDVDFNGVTEGEKTVNFSGNPVDNFWRSIMVDFSYRASVTGGNQKWQMTVTDPVVKRARADVFITQGRLLSSPNRVERCFNLPLDIVLRVFNCFFTLEKEISGKPNSMCKNYASQPQVMSPMQFLSNARQPVFERVQIQSDYGDDEDLEALMDYDPTLDGQELEKLSPSSHISDAEFERMLNESTNYDALSDHIMRENKAYSDGSTDMDIEEDAKSVSSKHSSSSVGSVASQMSNMSSHSVASNMSNMSSHSVASNMSNMSSNSVASNMSAQSGISVASNLSEKSNASTMSNMSHHSYASNHSIESQEAYPTSLHSDQSFGKYSDVSYNQTSGYSNSSSHSSSESSGKEMGYSNGLSESSDHGMSESSDHGMSESSDHDSSNETMGYSSSGGSSNNHSYNSNSETE